MMTLGILKIVFGGYLSQIAIAGGSDILLVFSLWVCIDGVGDLTTGHRMDKLIREVRRNRGEDSDWDARPKSTQAADTG